MNFRELISHRPDLAFIAHWVAPESHVLDLGCGDGVMLEYLQSVKKVELKPNPFLNMKKDGKKEPPKKPE